jgi:murein L,D-transpeptidase YafK
MTLLLVPADSFRQQQQKHQRVKDAYTDKEEVIKTYFRERNVSYTGFSLFIRAFKHEQLLEVWVKDIRKDNYTLLHTYPFCAVSGVPGPKRKEGDYQIPEGIYEINHFNPASNFHLSLGINYPNTSDKILSDARRPGGEIYIHGNCVTVGCIPITDDKIKELYILAVEARSGGQAHIPVHIYPAKLNRQGLDFLRAQTADNGTIKFWENLAPVYADFEKDKKLRPVKVNAKGQYYY